VKDDNPKSRPWKLQVAQRAGEAMLGRALFDGPMLLVLRFYRARPKGHFGTSGDLNAKGRRTPLPAVKPDTTKLVRGVEDALTGVVWRDDAQVCGQVALKEYGEPERVVIEVRPIASAADVVESEAYQMAMGL
jgi:Holliday junction resolvase RusA-like endonuclease